MAKRHINRAKKLRDELREALGNRCAKCPCNNPDELQFDHIHGSDWVLNKLSYLQRMLLYVKEHAAGKLRLLCGVCNRAARVPDERQGWQKTNAAGVPRERIPF